MSNVFFAKKRAILQAYILLGFGLIFLLGALLLHLNPFAVPVGLFLFGLGLLISAAFNPARLMIPGVIYTLIGAVIFIAYKPIIPFIPYDGGLVVIVVGIAMLALALLARQGYVGKGAMSPGFLVLLVGLFLYPPTGKAATKFFAPIILSLWFPGVMLLLIGLIYWFLSIRRRS
jgi:hypothetical protein